MDRNRRNFLHSAGMVSAGLMSSSWRDLFAGEANPPRWRTFELTTGVEVLNPSGATRIWIPAALTATTPYQKTIATTFQCEGGSVQRFQDKPEELEIISAKFPAGVRPLLTVTSRVVTRDWTVDLTGHDKPQKVSSAELRRFLQPTTFLPTDGIVKQTALKITGDGASDLVKARAIYDWIIENTYRNPKTRGCGTGNIRFMLESGDLGGKCADLNALYVGLARAAGLPARDVYGVRLARSERGYKSLGSASRNVTKAQHCRAEVYLHGYGWVPADPADVRKVILEEPPGHHSPDDEIVKAVRAQLFGSREMNWLAYNFAQDVALPGSSGPPLHFFMYPQAETAEGRLDSLDPDSFKYELTSREVTL